MSGRCDFCSGPDPEWIYPAGDFPMPNEGWGSSGAWAACERCSGVIERKDWDQLADIGVNTQLGLVLALPPELRPGVKQQVLELHRKFRRERRGPRRAFG